MSNESSTTSKGSISGFSYFIKGLSLITKPGVKRFVAIPLLINVFIFVVLIYAAGGYVSDTIKEYVPVMPDWLSWLSWLTVLLEILFYMLALLIMFYTFTFLANLVGAPFNGALSAAVEKHLTQQDPPGSGRNIMAEFSVTVASEARKWAYFLMLAIPLIIVSIVLLFIFSPLIPVLWFVFGSWMFSLEYLDYPMGNYGMTFPDIRNRIAQKRMISMSFGSAVTIGTMIPILNFIVMPVAVAGATAMRVEQFPMNVKTD